MEGPYHLFCLILVGTLFWDISPLKIPLENMETIQKLEQDVNEFLPVVEGAVRFFGCYSIIAYTGNFDLRPSLEQRLMDRLAIPIYTVGSNQGPLGRRYPEAETLVVVMFSGLDDPTLGAVNDTGLAYGGRQSFHFLSTNPLTSKMMGEFFNWCWERKFIRTLVMFQGDSEFEIWSYYKLEQLTVGKVSKGKRLTNRFRGLGYKFLVQAANDWPSIFWYNSSEQADVIGGGNISLSGDTGILIVEFMRYINATMDILPVLETQNSNYEFLEVGNDRQVDMVANLVVNDSYLFSPTVTRTKTCLLVPRFRTISGSRFFCTVIIPRMYHIMLATFVMVFAIKYIAHRRRSSLVDTFFATFRFVYGIPLPGGRLARLPLADKIVEVYCFLWVGILISTFCSLLSSILTTGMHYPPITDVESMRESGLRIMTADPTIKQTFEDNKMPSSLSDLVDLVDSHVIQQSILSLNDSYVYVTQTHNWKGLRLYQDHLKRKGYAIAGPKLCSGHHHLRLPISQYSPLRYIFSDYFYMIFESGLQQKWLLMGFEKFRNIFGIAKLPLDSEKEFKPLNMSFFMIFFKSYMYGMLLSTLVFVMEILFKRFHG